MLRTVAACALTAVVVSGSSGAAVETVTPAQIKTLTARVAVLESFRRNCLHHVRLTEASGGYMVWGEGASIHTGDFYAIPATDSVPAFCRF